MLKPLLHTAVATVAILLGTMSPMAYATPTNPWGSSSSDPVAETIQEKAQVEPVEAVQSESANADAAKQEADAEKAKKEKADFDAKAAKIDKEKIPDLEKPIEGKTIVARVVWVKGDFAATDKDTLKKRELKANSLIYLHDTLETQSRSTAQIAYTDNSSMTFRPDTVLYVNDYKYEKDAQKKKADEKSRGAYVMDLVTGGFRTVTGLVASEDPESYQVNTPVATIGVRGTEYSVVYEKDGQMFIKRYKGEPCVENEKSDGKQLCLDSKDQYATVDGKGSEPRTLIEQPSAFAIDVEIVPVTFSKGTVPSSFGSGIGSFCIQ